MPFEASLTNLWRPVLYILATLVIAWASRIPLRSSHFHGYYRFFAFEADLGLILLNLPVWFSHPFAWWQVISWILLLVSFFLAVHGFYLLKLIGRPQKAIENTTNLVAVGAYRYIRHPLYTSLICLAWGTFFKLPSVAGLAMALVACACLYATARVEEFENLQKFGKDYAVYMEKTTMFIPSWF